MRTCFQSLEMDEVCIIIFLQRDSKTMLHDLYVFSMKITRCDRT